MKSVWLPELEGPALDWAVALAEGRVGAVVREPTWPGTAIQDIGIEDGRVVAWAPSPERAYRPYTPSADWAQGGPVLERQRIGLFFDRAVGGRWRATHRVGTHRLHASALVAAMQLRVQLFLHDELWVEVPKELLADRR